MKVLHMLSTKQKEEWVLNEYDFYPEKIETLGSVKKVTCNQGIFALKKAKVSLGHFSFIVQCLHRLTEQHYPYILPLCRNKYGDYFVPIEGDAYYVTPWMEDKVEEKYLPQWEKILIEAMGQLHKKSLGVETNGNSAFSLTPPLLLRRWKQRVDDMEDLRNFAKSRDIMSPLEMTYVKHFEWLKEMATRAIRFLEEWDEKVPEGERRTVLCHGAFTERILFIQ
ncbi:hypothetical protein [Caldalkalibacillus mannanilyticus]|uniref:hypothetical protein n=1 Tax=Caldalkalibacillus mannanilyticus TaxID=1418 RepID=UPI00046970AC|nr:hypothetical protein [Caldalkalibacillus mannanilyticus]